MVREARHHDPDYADHGLSLYWLAAFPRLFRSLSLSSPTSARLIHRADTANGCLVARTISSTSKRTELHKRRVKIIARAATEFLCLEDGCFPGERRLRRVKRKLPILGAAHQENSLNPNIQRPSLNQTIKAQRPNKQSGSRTPTLRVDFYLSWMSLSSPLSFPFGLREPPRMLSP